jgi:AP-1 complex subunit beta-1
MSARGKKTGNDSRFFASSKKGENHELREELRSPQRDRKRDAVKKVIANMTIGKDVSTLFPDVINCIQTDNLELKKLVYLYLINYAKSQPDLALLAVNTFVKDANDPNPLIRALAIRTMGCIRVEKITEYLCEPLSRCLKDEDPYVRKTAAVCVAKLYDISPELVEDRGFVDNLREMISDANPTVVANAVSALNEIAENAGKDVMLMTANVLQKLLAALNECTEWGQVFILDSLSQYQPQDAREAEGIIERVTPRLQHANSAVVMSAVKVILRYLDEVTNQETVRAVCKKLAPPLVTLLNSEPEIQYVALRNINLIVLKRPKILEHEIKVFFCKYNDPIYVKMEKLEIIIRLVSEKNVEQVLLELKEYATEVDVDFVRRSVRAIGRCAIKLERATERCINVLLDLIKTKVSYVVQEAVVVIKDIFRKYPNRYEAIIGTLCENLEDLDEPEAKASMIWIIGEYAERIDNADELLDSFLESFSEETSLVQLQLLTATVKLFLKQPDSAQEMVQRVLSLATEHSDNPDLRDRGYVYWRLLSSDPEAARAVVLAQKPEIGDDTFTIEPALLDELISQISTLSSIYHKPVDAFVMKSLTMSNVEEEPEDEDDVIGVAEDEGDVPAQHYSSASAYASAPAKSTASNRPASNTTNDLLDLLDDTPVTQPTSSASAVQRQLVVNSETGKGVTISLASVQRDGQLVLDLEVGNTTAAPLTAIAIQLNKNLHGLAPVNPHVPLPTPVSNNRTVNVLVPLQINPQMANPADGTGQIQAAVKNLSTNAVFYFTFAVEFDALSVAAAAPDVTTFAAQWKAADESQEASVVIKDLPTLDLSAIQSKLAARHISFVVNRDLPGQDGQKAVYYFARTLNNSNFLIELKFKAGMNVCKVSVRSASKPIAEYCKLSVAKILLAQQ